MSEPITQAEVDEICAFCETHPNCRIQMEEDKSWCVVVTGQNNFVSYIHPRTFLDLIRGADDGEDILKVK